MTTRRGRGEGSIYYDDDRDRWSACSTSPSPAPGKRTRRKVSAETKTGVRQKLDALRRELADAGYAGPVAGTVGSVVADWVSHLPSPDQGPDHRGDRAPARQPDHRRAGPDTGQEAGGPRRRDAAGQDGRRRAVHEHHPGLPVGAGAVAGPGDARPAGAGQRRQAGRGARGHPPPVAVDDHQPGPAAARLGPDGVVAGLLHPGPVLRAAAR